MNQKPFSVLSVIFRLKILTYVKWATVFSFRRSESVTRVTSINRILSFIVRYHTRTSGHQIPSSFTEQRPPHITTLLDVSILQGIKIFALFRDF